MNQQSQVSPEAIVQAVSEIIGFEPSEEVHLDEEIDSLQSIELLISLEDLTGMPLDATQAYGEPPVTCRSIAEKLNKLITKNH